MNISLKRYILILIVLSCHCICALSQVVHISGNVYKTMKSLEDNKTSKKMPLSVPVYVFDNRQQANKQAAIYREHKQKNMGGVVDITSNAVVIPDYDGHFETDISASGALIVINEGEIRQVNITSALTYDIAFSGTTGGILLDNTTVIGKRMGANIVEMKPIDDGPYLHWDVTVSLPSWYTNKHTRLIFQPVVIDCQTEDTIQYLEPIVYEGKQYHNNQIRRKSFDYARHDSLHTFLIQDEMLREDAFSFKWKTTYVKPDPNKSYKWGSTLQLEDYTNVFFSDNSKSGTCNSRRPWKLLDVSMAMKPITLTPQYYEQPRAQLRQIPRDLRLTFEVAKDELTADSMNQFNLNHLIKELKSYGRTLINFTIQGTASPEGNDIFNAKLARKRADRALRLIGNQLSSAGLEVKEPLVYTWSDVADSLDGRSLKAEAARMRSYIGENNRKAILAMRNEVPQIDEILQNLRVMHCTYTIRQNKVLDPEEVLWTYYNDPDYREGGKSVFSNGDYYNLFSQIKDSVELRKLTLRAWNENKVRRTMKYSPFAAYLANRMACYAIEADSTDTEILAPFIDMASRLEADRQIDFDNAYRYRVNRRELVANQAIMYFKQMKLGEASHLANMLPDSPEYSDIKHFTDLETLFFKANKTPEEQKRAGEALQYVINSSKENNAILNFELAPELGKSYDEVEPLVDSLPDNDARKWYMKGVIDANKPEASDDEFMELAKKFGVDVALRMTDNSNPAFLAYFQHSFDLKPSLKGHFNCDANISDEVRKKYPYDEKKAPEYRQKFTDLMIAAGKIQPEATSEESSADDPSGLDAEPNHDGNN